MFKPETKNALEMHAHIDTEHPNHEEQAPDDYVSQFLGPFPEKKLPSPRNKVEDHQSSSQSIDPDQDSQFQSESQFLSEQSPKVKRSPLHNFQKHFVTTIRRNVTIRWGEQNEPSLKLAKLMWEIFKNSKKYTKQFVSLVLGSGNDQVDYSLLSKYDLDECVKNYSQSDYLKAQSFLRDEVLQCFRNVPKQKIMYDRRIGKKQQFANYFYKLLREVQDGTINKRMPKKRGRTCDKKGKKGWKGVVDNQKQNRPNLDRKQEE